MKSNFHRIIIGFFAGGIVISFILIYLSGSMHFFHPKKTVAPKVITRIAARDGMVQVYVPAGEFLMGSTREDINAILETCTHCRREWFDDEQPQRKVYLDAYWIDQTEVTNTMFAKFVAATGYRTYAEKVGAGIVLRMGTKEFRMTKGADWRHPRGPHTSIEGLENHPVVQINQNDAKAYCAWAERRLPTEAEWEKAARGTDGRIYPWGNEPPTGELLNFADRNLNGNGSDNTQDDGYEFTAPVGSYPKGASPYGALDMAGNAVERIAGYYDATYYAKSPKRNPTGPVTGTRYMIRGGSWSRMARFVRSADRYPYFELNRSSGMGFRCASSN
jgi:formylglycine-generating enzyme required for sulfatase activity